MEKIPISKTVHTADGYFLSQGNHLAYVTGDVVSWCNPEDLHHGTIRDFSVHGRTVVTAGEDKFIKKWQFSGKFELQATQELKKKPVRIQITLNGEAVLVSDKFGDVYRLDLNPFVLEERPFLGHLATVTDLAVTDAYLVSSDRDAKIRVSPLKRPHQIESFCLGHKEFVSKLVLSPARPGLLASGDGAGLLCLWDWQHGRRLDRIQGLRAPVIGLAWHGTELAVAYEGLPTLQVYNVQADNTQFGVAQSRDLPQPPLSVGFSPSGELYATLTRGNLVWSEAAWPVPAEIEAKLVTEAEHQALIAEFSEQKFKHFSSQQPKRQKQVPPAQ